ncbi:hypothetical protein LCGC14_1833390 [marine sediment metagenome]|uniref:Uncharacterized protein n=1 Tax=marine sediment metagenome TaxID=412755 RepID=A0A0F9H3I7_9ZZZZ
MTKARKQLIRKIAREVRAWAEEFAWRENGKHEDRFGSDLKRMCGICAYKLWSRLRELKVRASVAFGYYHVFVVVEEYLVDVSATQFGCVKVVLRLLKNADKTASLQKVCVYPSLNFVYSCSDTLHSTRHNQQSPFHYDELAA